LFSSILKSIGFCIEVRLRYGTRHYKQAPIRAPCYPTSTCNFRYRRLCRRSISAYTDIEGEILGYYSMRFTRADFICGYPMFASPEDLPVQQDHGHSPGNHLTRRAGPSESSHIGLAVTCKAADNLKLTPEQPACRPKHRLEPPSQSTESLSESRSDSSEQLSGLLSN
jgi:hypothetical protein